MLLLRTRTLKYTSMAAALSQAPASVFTIKYERQDYDTLGLTMLRGELCTV